MNITIIGDSWGVPNYHGSPGIEPKYHTEYLLRDLGYTVTNCAANGGSNVDSINRAFKNHSDYIIWFHTDLTRDIDLVSATNLNDTIIDLAHLTYQTASCLKGKFIVIGACATIHPVLFEYIDPVFYINDWVNDICNTNLPPLYTSYKVTPKVYKGMKEHEINFYVNDSKQILLEQYTNELNRLACMKRSGHFPDGGHPGIKPHADLVNTLKNTLP